MRITTLFPVACVAANTDGQQNSRLPGKTWDAIKGMMQQAYTTKLAAYIVSMLTLMFSLLCAVTQALAQTPVLLVHSAQDAIYNDYARYLEQRLAVQGKIQLKTALAAQITDQAQLDDHPLLITAGPQAAQRILALAPTVPVLLTLIPGQDYLPQAQSRYACPTTSCTVLLMDQPVHRQLRLVRLLFPQRNRIGILNHTGYQTPLLRQEELVRELNLKMVEIPVANTEQVVGQLQRHIREIEVLLAEPNPQIYNQNTAKGILLSTYYNKVPLLAYSASFVRAGATAGLYSELDDLARHAAEISNVLLKRPHNSLGVLYPRYFQIEINQRVSESLGLNLPAPATLLEAMKAYETK